MEKLLITNARIIDPSCQPAVDFVGDILIEGERIAKVGAHLKDSPIAQGAKLLDASGLCAAPGFLDIHVHLRDPGFTEKEDILTGCRAAAAGGVTSLLCMPNTKPAIDTPETVRYILDKASQARGYSGVRVSIIGAIFSKNSNGSISMTVVREPKRSATCPSGATCQCSTGGWRRRNFLSRLEMMCPP